MVGKLERLAIWNAYNRKCLYCDIPVPRISDMHIDHIFSEDLEEKPEEFEQVTLQYDLPSDFDLQEYYNLACSCGPCNRKKSNKRREKQVMLTYYSIAKEKEPIIKDLIKKYKDNIKTSNLLASIGTLLETKFLRPKEVVEFIHIVEEMVKKVHNPVTITFTIFKEEYEKHDPYHNWCDEYLNEIINKIKNNLSCLYAICEDDRDGEGFGVRIAFWGLNWQEFSENFSPQILDWDIVEVMNFHDFYQRSAADLFFNLEND
ncbi:hypothetical protein LCGC14_1336970 [marine sediment metagenome]|uniref:HNH domain-containing protein n=1 Tax=marine sediment metagenome TaxID=412755 RepID=A0A0F9KFK2_9ZZZZ|nr:hypothetical protein [bacterium]